MSEPFKIVNDIPLPPPKNKQDYTKYPFKDMKVGASFYFPDKKPKTISAIARFWGKRLNMGFNIRSEGTGARIWRVR